MALSSLIALACFCLSGFASLTYQTTWLRQTMALFGSATSTVAAMLSIFMAGLTLGSYVAGGWTRRWSARQALVAYVVVECVIGLGGVAAGPIMEGFRQTAWWLHAPDMATRWVLTIGFLVVALLPWTFAMGATYPVFLRSVGEGGVGFGWLYAANVGGAMLGTLSAGYVLFEYLGFSRAQWVGVAANTTAALLALAWLAASRKPTEALVREEAPVQSTGAGRDNGLVVATFVIGFVSLGYEVVWTRVYTPVLGTVVYAFSSLLATYLGATLLGSLMYRWMIGRRIEVATVHRCLGPLVIASGVLPHVATSSAWLSTGWKLALGLGPFCFLTGLWTPLLVEQYAAGRPERVGRIYAWNGFGCLLGPLVAGFILMPFFGSKLTLLVLTCLLVVPAWVVPASLKAWSLIPMLAVVPAFSLVSTFEERIGSARILHDSTATVAAWGWDRDRQLFVNGISMTGLVNETKWMMHLPGLIHGKPKKVLVICFGMGTSFRSALSWGAEVTSVDLVPSVPKMFAYFHSDADEVMRNPHGRIVIDDGRHFLETTTERYDVIVVDPPPPLEAAGSSVLNSREFFAAARRALNPGGLLLHWMPGGAFLTELALASTLAEEFPHLVAFRSPGWVRGLYMVASASTLELPSPREALETVSARVRADMQEWMAPEDVLPELASIFGRRITREEILMWSGGAARLLDDFPVNEYYWVRRPSSFLPRAVTFVLGAPPVVKRLNEFVQREVRGISGDSYTRDPRFFRYRIAMTFHNYGLAARNMQIVSARHPRSIEARNLAEDAQHRWERDIEVLVKRSRSPAG